MIYSLTLREEEYEKLRAVVFSKPGLEGAAYILCGASQTDDELRFLGREIISVAPEHYLERRGDYLSISSQSYVAVAKQAKQFNTAILFVHSHPEGYLGFSPQDNREEPKLQEFFRERVPGLTHGSLLLTQTGISGRVFADGFVSMNRIRIMGTRFSFYDPSRRNVDLRLFDRQVRAFGPELQQVLGSLHVGVVGAGGTGSAVIEQLTRLGVGAISVFDGDNFDDTNVNRIYGSSVSDVDKPKVDIAKSNIDQIGLSTRVHCIGHYITQESAAMKLRSCDLIFGCTDKETPRAILTQLSLRYLIPVIDLGVLILSKEGVIQDVVGRVTTLMAGEACLFCRKRITPERIRLENLSKMEGAALVREGYAPELETPTPAVIPFTSATASLGVSELLHRLTGFMGSERKSTEVLCFLDQTKLSTNRPLPASGCLCSDQTNWAVGDTDPFLETTWPS